MTKLLFAASAAALLTVAGTVPSLAQSSSSGVTGGSMTTPMITCRDLTTMDRDTARSVVFFFSGYQTGSGMAMSNQASAAGGASGSGTTDTTGTTASGSSSTAADAGSTSGTTGSDTSSTAASGSDTSSATADSGSTSGTASGSGTTTSADAGTSGSASTDTTGSTSTAGSSDASGASGGASSAVVAQLPGFSSIDIDRIMADCQSSPDRQLSEMIQSGASGSTTP